MDDVLGRRGLGFIRGSEFIGTVFFGVVCVVV